MYRFYFPMMALFAAPQDQSLTHQLCIQQGTLKSFQTVPNDTLGENGCKEWFFGNGSDGHVSLRGESITRFEDGWCGVRGKIIYLDLSDNNIVDITRGMLDSLEIGLQRVFLRNNKIERIRRGTIDRGDVLWLDLSHNSIHGIEIGALEHLPRLEMLNLTGNQITDIKFVASLPIDVMWLYLNYNAMSAIPDYLLSSLPNLEVLELAHNNIWRIGKRVLEGITNLHQLDLSFNPISKNETSKIIFDNSVPSVEWLSEINY